MIAREVKRAAGKPGGVSSVSPARSPGGVPDVSSSASPDDSLADLQQHSQQRFAGDAPAQRSDDAKRSQQRAQASRSSSSQPLFGAFVQKPGRSGAISHDADAPKADATTDRLADSPADLHAIEPAQWPDDAVEVGAVVDAYGLKGQVKVIAHAASQGQGGGNALLSATHWWLMKKDERGGRGRSSYWAVAGVSARAHGDGIVAQLGGVADRDAALRLRGCGVYVRRSAFPALADDEFYWVDLLGLDVLNEAGVALGQVAGMIDNGAHSVLRVAYPSTGKNGQPATGERLIPFVGVYVKTVDLAARRIVVEWEADY